MVTIRYGADGRPQQQQVTQSSSAVTSNGASLFAVSLKLPPGGQPTVVQQSSTVTTQPSPTVRRSESSTQVRDANGNLKTKSRATTTETQVSSDTTRTETEFQESRTLNGELATTARMREVRKEKSDGSEYQRTFETKTASGEFRPRQKVEAETRNYSDGSAQTRSVESSFDMNGNVRPVQETTEKKSSENSGKLKIERVINKIEQSGDSKLVRVELEKKDRLATSGVVDEKVVKQPDPSYGLRETQIVTTTIGRYYSGSPYRITVTREYPRNDRFGLPLIMRVEIEKSSRRPDGSVCVEKELKVRDINGNLATVSTTQIETKGDAQAPAASSPGPESAR